MWDKIVDSSATQRKMVAFAVIAVFILLFFLIRNDITRTNANAENETPTIVETNIGQSYETVAKDQGFVYENTIIPFSEETLLKATSISMATVGILTDPTLTDQQKISDIDPFTTQGLTIIGNPNTPRYTQPPRLQPAGFTSITETNVVLKVSVDDTYLMVYLENIGGQWKVHDVKTPSMESEWGKSA